MKSFIEQDLANIAWSYAVSNGDAPSVFNDAFTKVLLCKENKFSIEELRQLYQWHLWQTREMIYNGLPTMLAGIHRAIKQHHILKKMLSDNLFCLGRIRLKSFSLRDLQDPNGRTMLKYRQVVPKIDKLPLVSVPY